MAKLVTLRAIVNDDAQAHHTAQYLLAAARSVLGETADVESRTVPTCGSFATLKPVDATESGPQLFDKLTGEEVIGREMTVPALSGYSFARATDDGYELVGEHLLELFEHNATLKTDRAGSIESAFVTVTGRRIGQDRLDLRELATEEPA